YGVGANTVTRNSTKKSEPKMQASPVRRPHLLEKEEALLLPRADSDTLGIFKTVTRLEQLSQTTGIDEEDLISSRLVAIPIPDYTAIPDGERRWPTTRPDSM